MSVKEKVIAESIRRIEKRLAEISAILEARPAEDLIAINEEFKRLLEENQGIEKRTSREFMEKINKLCDRRQQCFKSNIPFSEIEKLIDEEVELASELTELKNEEWLLKRRLS